MTCADCKHFVKGSYTCYELNDDGTKPDYFDGYCGYYYEKNHRNESGLDWLPGDFGTWSWSRCRSHFEPKR